MSELKQLIRQGEGLHLDFKFRIDDQKKIAKTLAAFANSEGGKLLVGVKDNGKIVGVNPEEEYYMVEGAAQMNCQPPVSFTSDVWQEGHHLVLIVEVPKSDVRHKARGEDKRWRTYYRVKDNTVAGNKVLDKLWAHRRGSLEKPNSFSDSELEIIKLIQLNERIRISKLYRDSGFKKGDVDRILAALIHWELVGFEFMEDSIYYYLRQE